MSGMPVLLLDFRYDPIVATQHQLDPPREGGFVLDPVGDGVFCDLDVFTKVTDEVRHLELGASNGDFQHAI